MLAHHKFALRPSWRSCARLLMHCALRCNRHCGHARVRWRVASYVATAMEVVRAIADASQVVMRPPWRSCARSLMHRVSRRDHHCDRVRDRCCIAGRAAIVTAVMRAIADAPQVELRPSLCSRARSLALRKLHCDRHGGHVRNRWRVARRAASIIAVMCAFAVASKLRCDRHGGYAHDR